MAYEKWRRGAERVGPIDGTPVLERDVRRVTAGWCQQVHDAVTKSSGEAQADNVVKLLQAAWEHERARGGQLKACPWKAVKRHGSKPPKIIFPEGWRRDWLDVIERATKDPLFEAISEDLRKQARAAGKKTLPPAGKLPQRFADLLTVVTDFGLRWRCEASPMRWEDLRKSEGLLLLPFSKEEPRAVPLELLSSRGWAAIERQRGLSDVWIWPGERSKGPIGETTVRKFWPAIREYADRSGLMFRDLDGDWLTIHALRHAFADYGSSVLGLPDEVVAQLLGHSDKRSTVRYQHWHVSHLRESARAFAAGAGDSEVAEAAEVLGVRRDRVARAIKIAGGSEVFAQADKRVAELVGKSPSAVASWRVPSSDVDCPHVPLQQLAEAVAAKTGQSPVAVLGWLYGYGGEELPERRLRIVS